MACLGADLQAGQHGFGAGGQQRAQHGEHEFHRIHRDWEAVVVVSGLFTGASVEDLP